jgi:hypothetical protein
MTFVLTWASSSTHDFLQVTSVYYLTLQQKMKVTLTKSESLSLGVSVTSKRHPNIVGPIKRLGSPAADLYSEHSRQQQNC